jgi:hypothetical protein
VTTADSTADPASEPRADGDADTKRRLAVYLQDHDAGAQAGVALIRRCQDSNRDTEFGTGLADLARETDEDRKSLRSIMEQLDVQPSRVKELVGNAAEFVARLKTNGHLVRYSPSSRVVELEAIAAAFAMKRNLWRALAAAGPSAVSRAELDQLIERATDQFERALVLHERAAALAFAAAD